MRPTLVASLLLSPMLITASAVAIQPKTDTPASKQDVRVSSLTAPSMIGQPNFHIPAEALHDASASEAKVVVSFYVDPKGTAQSVRIVKSVNPDLDARVVDAVLQSRFHPATLDSKPVTSSMDLVVVVQR